MPGPPPQHPNLRLLKGSPGKRRVRVPPEPSRSEAPPPPPKHLKGHARQCWLELAPQLHALNLLTLVDAAAFATYCSAYGLWHDVQD